MEILIAYVTGWGKHWTENEDPDAPTPPGGFIVGWAAKGVGFGELTVGFEGGKIKVDDECMGREFCDAVLKKLTEVVPSVKDNKCEHGSTLAQCTMCQGGIP
jgi:hypothetical protein